MQGISKSRHTHLVDALLQIEQLLNKECECLQQVNEYRLELESMHSTYGCLLDRLAKQITDYEMLYSHVKVQFLSKKPKELKKEISTDRTTSIPALALLHNNIQLAYGT